MSKTIITGVRTLAISDSGSFLVTFSTKYSGDFAIEVVTDCIQDLADKIASASTHKSAPDVEASRVSKSRLELAEEPKGLKKRRGADGKLQVRVPKSWAITSETEKHNVVLIMFDPKSAIQSGFALSPGAAKDMAEALRKNSTFVLNNISKAAFKKAKPRAK